MHSTGSAPLRPTDILTSLQTHWRRWLIPTAVIVLVAAAYAVLRTPWWEASQAVVLRNEAANNQEGPGQFRQLDDMKVTQETVLELAKSTHVLSAALAEVLPQPPTMTDVAELRALLTLAPPKGAEFGKTELFYLKVRDRDRGRAERLLSAIARHLQSSLQELRRAKAQSMIDELAHSASLAEADLAASIKRLAELETRIGSDLGELRMLDLSGTADSDLRRKLVMIDEEIRQTQTAQASSQELHALLLAAQQDPNQLLATPNRLLESQPALRRLKEGLVDAQLRTSQLVGTMLPEHPQVVAARLAESEVRRQLHTELEAATRGVAVEQRLAATRLEMLLQERALSTGRLEKVASLRAEYSGLVNETKHRTALVENAQREWSEARACQAGATASLITLIDRPETGDRPVGPTLATILLVGIVGGLACGWGCLFLTTPLPGSDSNGPTHSSGPQQRNGRSLSLNEALSKVAAL